MIDSWMLPLLLWNSFRVQKTDFLSEKVLFGTSSCTELLAITTAPLTRLTVDAFPLLVTRSQLDYRQGWARGQARFKP